MQQKDNLCDKAVGLQSHGITEKSDISRHQKCYVPSHHSFIPDLQCVASINSKAIRYNVSYKYNL